MYCAGSTVKPDFCLRAIIGVRKTFLRKACVQNLEVDLLPPLSFSSQCLALCRVVSIYKTRTVHRIAQKDKLTVRVFFLLCFNLQKKNVWTQELPLWKTSACLAAGLGGNFSTTKATVASNIWIFNTLPGLPDPQQRQQHWSRNTR